MDEQKFDISNLGSQSLLGSALVSLESRMVRGQYLRLVRSLVNDRLAEHDSIKGYTVGALVHFKIEELCSFLISTGGPALEEGNRLLVELDQIAKSLIPLHKGVEDTLLDANGALWYVIDRETIHDYPHAVYVCPYYATFPGTFECQLRDADFRYIKTVPMQRLANSKNFIDLLPQIQTNLKHRPISKES